MSRVMTADEALDWKARISATANQLRLLLFEGYERHAWIALGYATWTDCLQALAEEYRFSERRLWQLHAANQIEQHVTEPGSVGHIPERALRPLAGLAPNEQREVWQAVVQSTPDRAPTSTQVETVVHQRQAETRATRVTLVDAIRQSPALSRYEASYTAGLLTGRLTAAGGVELTAKTLRKPLPSCPPWPKYTGMRRRQPQGHDWEAWEDRLLDIPLFSAEEWQDLSGFQPLEVLQAYAPELTWNRYDHQGDLVRPSAAIRRDYDPAYGRVIVPTAPEDQTWRRVFVRRGWGGWRVVRFNDGAGHRTTRRYFAQDYYGDTLITLAFETANPDLISDVDAHQLETRCIQTAQMSWFYCRLETKARQEVIAALRADLERLSQVEALTDDQIEQRALDWLQTFTPGGVYTEGFREGRVTVAVDACGLTDKDALEARFPKPAPRK
jgi:hypothetical protein